MPEALEDIGESSAGWQPPCITRELPSCSGDLDTSSCPAFRFGDGEPVCTEFGSCDSAVELQILAPEGADDPAAALADTGYCIADSIGADGLESGCAVLRSRYELTQCGAGTSFGWSSPGEATNVLEGFQVRMRYVTAEAE